MRIALLLLCILFPLSNAAGRELAIYVSDAGNFSSPPWQILKFDENGENSEVFITQNLAWPQDILFLEEAGTVLVSNLNSGRIDRYDAATGAFIDIFDSGIGGPTRMKIGPDKLLYVLQWGGNGRVLRYRLDGTLVDQFTGSGVTQSIGLDWDSDGNLYVASYNGRFVRKFDSSGIDQGLFVSNNLAGPTNIWFDAAGDLLVTDYDGGAVKRFGPDGVFKGNFISNLANAEGVDFLPGGNILIGNGGTSAVKMFTADGVYLEDLVASGAGGLKTPNAVVVREIPSGFQINQGITDAWYNPATNGQGFLVTVFPDREEVFLAWFTFDTERPPDDVGAILGEPGHRWLTAQGPFSGETADLTLYVTAGGVFDSATPPASTDPDGDGTLTLEFADCRSGLVSYQITSLGISGEIPIQRITEDNVALCEELAGQ